MNISFQKLKNRISYLLIITGLSLAACGGSTLGGFANQGTDGSSTNPGSISQDKNDNGSDSATDSPNDSGSTQNPVASRTSAPTAQPTYPVPIQVALFVQGSVVMPGKTPDPECGKDSKHPAPFENIPTVKSWQKEEGENWVLKTILGKYESDEDANNPYIVDHCGNFYGRLYLTLGPRENRCLWNDQAKFTATYKNSNGVFYSGESHIYSCHDAQKLPTAIIELQESPMMMMPSKNLGFTP